MSFLRVITDITIASTVWLVNINYFGYNGYCMATDKPLLIFVIEPELLKRVDDFRFKHRFASRAAAIKWMLRWTLAQNPKPEKEQK